MAQDNHSGGGLLHSIKSAPFPVIGGLAALVVIGIIFVAVALSGGGDGDGDGNTAAGATPTASSGGLQTSEPTVEATIDPARPTAAAAENLTSVGPGDRLVIPKFGVDAPLTYRSVGL